MSKLQLKIKDVKLSSNLIQSLNDYGHNVCLGMAKQVRDELNDEAVYALENFYASYAPKNGPILSGGYEWKFKTPKGVPYVYDRTYTNFLKKSFKKYKQDKHHSIVYGGVELSPDFMDSIYQNPVETVFDFVMSGIHGHPSLGLQQMDPSPIEIIRNKKKEIVENIQDYRQYGIDEANSRSYKTTII